MPAKLNAGTISANCPGCNGALTAYEARADGGNGYIIIDRVHEYEGKRFTRIFYCLMRCGGCRRGGLAVIHDGGNMEGGVLEEFFPSSIERALLPDEVPEGIRNEFQEAELCAAHGAYRAASAMLRSVLEKTLTANGYVNGNLKEKIEKAASEKILTETRKNRAHENRELGNDVVHDDWREVVPSEYESAHKYAQRILEDFYDDRATVAAQLRGLKRLV